MPSSAVAKAIFVNISSFLSQGTTEFISDGVVGAEIHSWIEFTKRQNDIMILIDKALSNQEITDQL
jgi:DNA-binding NarL/FixJ family response regulator